MERLTKKEYEMVQYYQQTKDTDISLYFFNKFRQDLVDIVYSKINRKFSSIPYEKGDLIHLIWKGVLKTLEQYKKDENFNMVLIRNCYTATIKEAKKFINNRELIMNISSSDNPTKYRLFARNQIANFEYDREIVLTNIVELACEYIKTIPEKDVKRIIFLKSLGYSMDDIAKKLKIKRYHVDQIIKLLKKIVDKFYL